MRRQLDRVGNLERSANGNLPPAVKAWLGQPLTADDKRQLDDGVVTKPDCDAIDTSEWSAEMKQWLGVN